MKQYTPLMTAFFYDVSTWTKPLAFNMPYTTIDSSRQLHALLGEKVVQPEKPSGTLHGEMADMAYVFNWDEYYAPRALYALQRKGLRTRVPPAPSICRQVAKNAHFIMGR